MNEENFLIIMIMNCPHNIIAMNIKSFRDQEFNKGSSSEKLSKGSCHA